MFFSLIIKLINPSETSIMKLFFTKIELLTYRSVFKSLSNFYDEVFFAKIANGFFTQSAFKFSKLTIEALEQGVKYVQR